MKIRDIMEILKARPLTKTIAGDLEVTCACASDMMSDVLAFPKEDMVLLTGLTNPQVMRTCEMLDIEAVVFTRGKLPAQEALDMAEENGISVLATDYTLFIASGILYSKGLTGSTKV